jgi:DNA/RNA non-specific endonuclease/Pretoxin HINT domain
VGCIGDFCFPAGTLITAKEKGLRILKKIENIAIGDTVGSFDHKLNLFAWNIVTNTRQRVKQGLVAIYAMGTLIAQPTFGHQIWSESKQKYIAAKNFHAGDLLLSADAKPIKIDSLINLDKSVTVYNFGVENLHNYFVGEQAVLVHNNCPEISDLIALDPKRRIEGKITEFTNAFKKSGISKIQKKALLTRLKNELTPDEIVDFMDEFIALKDNKLKKYLGANPDAIKAWKGFKNFSKKQEYLELLSTLGTKNNPVKTRINTDGLVEIIDENNSSKPWNTFHKDKITGKGGPSAGLWNEVINVVPLIPNHKYVVDDKFIYETDGFGRVEAITVPDFQTGPSRVRWEDEQGRAKTRKNGNANDDGGHMIRAQYNGPSEQINYFPQNPQKNRPGTGGDWFNMEEEWKTIKDAPANAGKILKIEIIPIFSGNSKRPDMFEVYMRDANTGALIKPWTISNP